jgi:hypothetical protein
MTLFQLMNVNPVMDLHKKCWGLLRPLRKNTMRMGTKYHVIQVIRQDDHQPTFILIGKEATVGSIVVAETKLGTPPICMTTSGGTRYPSPSTTKPYDQVFLKEMSKYGSGTTRDQVKMLELTFHEPMQRIALPFRREAYVAEDEIQFYLKMLTATEQAVHALIAIIPSNCEDENIIAILQNWDAQTLLVADTNSKPRLIPT